MRWIESCGQHEKEQNSVSPRFPNWLVDHTHRSTTMIECLPCLQPSEFMPMGQQPPGWTKTRVTSLSLIPRLYKNKWLSSGRRGGYFISEVTSSQISN
ncbi:hypothetical protein Hypma_000548 [Hypsizygus marmoreus]|uniref:Uncharacterized protein n=1 Tax=Hypsizygus marmoreus TaxID=39966 RepID=A0A369J8E4_HYPMA|nr:hypothetical protein Hypma_000548 [Hypsizygus marmoreus]